MKVVLIALALVGSSFAIQNIDWSKVKPFQAFQEPLSTSPLSPISPRVIGGSEAPRNSIPYQAAVLINGTNLCGGSLISLNFVLTAAHCTIDALFANIILGAHDLYVSETSQLVLNSNTFINHKDYNPRTYANDIALIHIQQITTNNNIQRVSLAGSSQGDFNGDTAILAGWGRISDDTTSISAKLQHVSVSIISNDACRSTFGTLIQDGNICTSGAGNVGSCDGDSGGPLVRNGIQVGIVSFRSSRCNDGNPTVYTRLSNYASWIVEQIANIS